MNIGVQCGPNPDRLGRTRETIIVDDILLSFDGSSSDRLHRFSTSLYINFLGSERFLVQFE